MVRNASTIREFFNRQERNQKGRNAVNILAKSRPAPISPESSASAPTPARRLPLLLPRPTRSAFLNLLLAVRLRLFHSGGVSTRNRAEAVGDHQAAVVTEVPDLTDGFHLVIDALKLNGIDTIYGVPGIPITDLGRLAQAEGMRVISFRHEQNAGNAAAIAGYLTKKPGICLTVSAPGFLNGLTALANATTNCFPMILISGSSEREIVDLQQGDYEEMDQLAIAKPLCKAAFRVLHAADVGIAVATGDPRRRLGPSGRRLSRSPRQAAVPDHSRGDGTKVAGQGHRRGTGADSGQGSGEARA